MAGTCKCLCSSNGCDVSAVYGNAGQCGTSRCNAADGDNDLKLWYTSPADITKYYEGWQEKSLPIGNGAIGGTVFGGITRERIQLNEKSLWSGGQAPADRITMEVTWRTREITERL